MAGNKSVTGGKERERESNRERERQRERRRERRKECERQRDEEKQQGRMTLCDNIETLKDMAAHKVSFSPACLLPWV